MHEAAQLASHCLTRRARSLAERDFLCSTHRSPARGDLRRCGGPKWASMSTPEPPCRVVGTYAQFTPRFTQPLRRTATTPRRPTPIKSDQHGSRRQLLHSPQETSTSRRTRASKAVNTAMLAMPIQMSVLSCDRAGAGIAGRVSRGVHRRRA